MKLLPDSLASRLTLLYSAAFIGFLSIAFPASYLFMNSLVQREADADLVGDIADFHSLWRVEGMERVKEEIGREIASESPTRLFLRLLDRSGEVVYATDMSHWPRLTANQEAVRAVVNGSEPVLETRFRKVDGAEFRSVYGRVAPGTVLQIGETTEGQRAFMDLLLELFFTTYLVVVPASALIGWLVARKALGGIEEVSMAAEQIANGNLDRHVSVGVRGSEIERLVGNFNTMVDRVQALITGMREMTDNIAHDMKSPLARIRTNSELALTSATSIEAFKSSTAETLEECDRLLQMIDTTLDVSEVEAGANGRTQQPVDIGALVAEACELFLPVAEDKGIRLSAAVDGNCQVEVRGNLQHLQRMLANLIDNGIKFTERNGKVVIRVESKGNRVRISVCDTGIGIPTADQNKIFDRFVRGDQSRSHPGFGLGLSFSRAVAHSHGGDIRVASSPGGGSVFMVTLAAGQCSAEQ